MTSLLPYNTFGIDANALCLKEYNSEAELLDIIKLLPKEYPSKKVLHIGGGSNLLFLGDFDGVIIHSCIKGVEIISETQNHIKIRVGAGMVWDDFVAYTIDHEWYGLENLSLIPGEVGASAVQNIGAYGREAKDFIVNVECIDLKSGVKRVFNNEECAYGYRQSIFKSDEVRGRYAVTYVVYQLNKSFEPYLEYGGLRNILADRVNDGTLTPEVLRKTIIEIREAKLPNPKVQGNAGSFFMNPVVSRSKYEELAAQYEGMPHYYVDAEHVKIPAGWMIEQCGWKGRSIGPAAVHDRQALVLVNKGGAKGEDIVRLCEAIRSDVRKKFGIDIHPEVNFI